MILLLLTFFFLGFVFHGFFSIKILKKYGWTTIVYSSFFLNIFYFLFPFISLVIFYDSNGGWSSFAYKIPAHNDNLEVVIYSYLVMLIGIISVYYGYFYSSFKSADYQYKKIKGVKSLKLINYLIFIIAVIGFYKYISGFGTLNNAIANTALIRAGAYKSIESGDTSHTFYFRFIFLAIIPFMFFLFNKEKKSIIAYLLFIISSVLVFVLYFFLSGGRQNVLDLFLIVLIFSMIKKNKIFNYKLFFLGITSFLLLPILLEFFKGDKGINKDYLNVFVNEFGFPFYSLMYSVQESYSWSLFIDFIDNLYGSVFPSSLKPEGMLGINYLNSEFLIERKAKYVPPGIFAQGYYSLGILGVILISFFTGKFFKWVDVFFQSLMNLNLNYSIFYSYLIVKSMSWIRTGLPSNYFYDFTILLLIFFMRITVKRVK